jgi:hypothetical protein
VLHKCRACALLGRAWHGSMPRAGSEPHPRLPCPPPGTSSAARWPRWTRRGAC